MIKEFKIFLLCFITFFILIPISFSGSLTVYECYGSMSFDGTTLHCSEDKIENGGGSKVGGRSYTPSNPDVYFCIEEPEWYFPSPFDEDDVKGGCRLVESSSPSPSPTPGTIPTPSPTPSSCLYNSDTIPIGSTKTYLKIKSSSSLS